MTKKHTDTAELVKALRRMARDSYHYPETFTTAADRLEALQAVVDAVELRVAMIREQYALGLKCGDMEAKAIDDAMDEIAAALAADAKSNTDTTQ